MTTNNKKIVSTSTVFLFFMAGLVFAADDAGSSGVIWQKDRNTFIRYADLDQSANGTNDHPAQLGAEEVRKALTSLKLQQDKKDDESDEPASLFTDEQVDTLSQYLREGLAGAKPNQDVVFALDKNVKTLFGLKTKRVFVAGRAFYTDGQLNVLIGDYDRPADEGFEAAYDPTHMGIVNYNFDHGRRTRDTRAFVRSVIPVEGVENKRVEGAARNDWLLIDVTAASEASDAREMQRQAEEKAKKRAEITELLAGEDVAPAGPAASTPASQSIEERLTILNDLKEKGLVSDEEYATKRKQILEEL
ncbi:MAG: SHOCT domain-containing protein [Gammaproteobacteria bacterium]|nr:SHOCT domain-containing protein [Gammaproteobacteria bacterium]